MYNLAYRCARCRIAFVESLGKYGCPNDCGGRPARLIQTKPGLVIYGAEPHKTQQKAASHV